MATTDSAIRTAVAKAVKVKPPAFKLCEGFWAAPSLSKPGTGYMIEVFEGKVSCECQGFERTGCCYHAAHVAMQEGLLPERFIPQPAPEPHETALLVSAAPRGRRSLFAATD